MLTDNERAILEHAHAHHIGGEPIGDTEALFGRNFSLFHAKAEWLAEQNAALYPELAAYFDKRRNLDWSELDESASRGCGRGMLEEDDLIDFDGWG